MFFTCTVLRNTTTWLHMYVCVLSAPELQMIPFLGVIRFRVRCTPQKKNEKRNAMYMHNPHMSGNSICVRTRLITCTVLIFFVCNLFVLTVLGFHKYTRKGTLVMEDM